MIERDAGRLGVFGVLDDATPALNPEVTESPFRSAAEFPALTAVHRIEGLATQHEVLVAYAREVGIAPTIEGRIDRRVE